MVKQGYHKTDIGTIPDEWSVVKVKDIVTAPLSYGVNAAAVEYDSNLPRYIRITDITDDGRYDYSNKVSINIEGSDRYTLAVGDVLFARTGASTGKTYLYTESDGKLIYAGFLIRASIDTNKYDPYYVFLQFHTPRYYDWVSVMSTRSGQPGINGKEYGSFELPIPPIGEQKRIATALSDIDALIANLEKLITKKKAIKQGAMQELLTGKRRLPGFSGDWTECILTDVADLITDTIPVSDIDPRYYIGTDNMVSNRGGVKQNRIGLQYSAVRHYTINDILLSNIRPYLKKIWYADTNGGCSNDVLVIRTKNDGKILAGFLYQLLSQDAFFDEVTANAVGTKMPRGDKNVIKTYPLCMPVDLQEQREILKILSEMQVEIENLEKNLNKYKQIKQGMMSDLLTGRIRLIDKEDA